MIYPYIYNINDQMFKTRLLIAYPIIIQLLFPSLFHGKTIAMKNIVYIFDYMKF